MSEQTVAEQPKAKTLVTKLCEAGAAVGWIEKGGYNEFHKYKYATEADIVSALRGELFKRQVFIFPSFTRHERKEIEVETMKWDDKVKAKVPSVRKTALTEVDIEWTFTDGESGETIKVMVPGIGEDSMDKGLYKAFTGSEKYLLMKSFLLPTGDDPERDSDEDAKEAKHSGSEAGKAVTERKKKEAGERQEASKSVSCLFYCYPESHNGHMAHWLNVSLFAAANEDKADSLRMVFTAHKAKKTADGGALVPYAEMGPLMEKLAGDMGISVKELKGA